MQGSIPVRRGVPERVVAGSVLGIALRTRPRVDLKIGPATDLKNRPEIDSVVNKSHRAKKARPQESGTGHSVVRSGLIRLPDSFYL